MITIYLHLPFESNYFVGLAAFLTSSGITTELQRSLWILIWNLILLFLLLLNH